MAAVGRRAETVGNPIRARLVYECASKQEDCPNGGLKRGLTSIGPAQITTEPITAINSYSGSSHFLLLMYVDWPIFFFFVGIVARPWVNSQFPYFIVSALLLTLYFNIKIKITTTLILYQFWNKNDNNVFAAINLVNLLIVFLYVYYFENKKNLDTRDFQSKYYILANASNWYLAQLVE